MPSPKDCEHPNPRPKADVVGNVDVVCPDCKLSVTSAQMLLSAMWWKKIKEARGR